MPTPEEIKAIEAKVAEDKRKHDAAELAKHPPAPNLRPNASGPFVQASQSEEAQRLQAEKGGTQREPGLQPTLGVTAATDPILPAIPAGTITADQLQDDERLKAYYALRHGLPVSAVIADALQRWIAFVNSKPTMSELEYDIVFDKFRTEVQEAFRISEEIRRKPE